MANPRTRGSAPGRAREASERSGSFKQGREKQGGRKRGTPNAFSPDYKNAIFEAAHRIGEDGNGHDGLVGYFRWIAIHHTRTFLTLLSGVLSLQSVESGTTEELRRTMHDINEGVAEDVGLSDKKPTNGRTVQVESQSPWDWTGQGFPVGSLMQLAVKSPQQFGKLFAAMLPRPPTERQRALAARRAWEARERADAQARMLARFLVEKNKRFNKG